MHSINSGQDDEKPKQKFLGSRRRPCAIEKVFLDYFQSQGLITAPTPLIAVGIPAGGLFTSAESIKTAQPAAEAAD